MTDDSPVRRKDPHWRVADEVAWTSSDQRAVVLVVKDEDASPIALEGSALSVWTALTEHGPIGERDLIAKLADEFEIDPDLIGTDVRDLLANLGRRSAVAHD